MLAFGCIAAFAFGSGTTQPAGAAPTITAPTITAPTITAPTLTTPITTAPAGTGSGTTGATGATGSSSGTGSISIDLGNLGGSADPKNPNQKPNQSVVIILLLTVLAVAPALMVMLTSFTRIVIVLSLTRNALGLTVDPAQPGRDRACVCSSASS